MADLTLAVLRRDGEAFMEALSREQYLALAGHKPNAELRPIYDRFAHVLGPGALELVQQCGHMIVELREGQMRCMRKSRIFLHASAPAHEDGVTPGRKAARKCGQFTR